MTGLAKKIKDFWLGEEAQEDSVGSKNKEDGFDELFYIDASTNHEKSKPPQAKEEEKRRHIKESNFLDENSSLKKEQNLPKLKVIENSSPIYSPTSEVVVIEPSSFNQAPEVIRCLWRGSSVVLNLCNLDPRESQRLVDFICGGVFAMNGSQKRVGEGVFLLVPSNVNIKKEEKKENRKSNFSEILNLDFSTKSSNSSSK